MKTCQITTHIHTNLSHLQTLLTPIRLQQTHTNQFMSHLQSLWTPVRLQHTHTHTHKPIYKSPKSLWTPVRLQHTHKPIYESPKSLWTPVRLQQTHTHKPIYESPKSLWTPLRLQHTDTNQFMSQYILYEYLSDYDNTQHTPISRKSAQQLTILNILRESLLRRNCGLLYYRI